MARVKNGGKSRSPAKGTRGKGKASTKERKIATGPTTMRNPDIQQATRKAYSQEDGSQGPPSKKPRTKKTTGEGPKSAVQNVRSECTQLTDSHTWFLSQKAFERYSSTFLKRNVTRGRPISIDFFKKEKFLFVKWYKDMGWMPYLQIEEQVYPRLVRAFYANLVYSDKPFGIQSFVKGKVIAIDCKRLGEILGVDSDGYECGDLRDFPPVEEFDREEAYEMFYGHPIAKFEKSVKHFTLEMRMAQYVLVNCIKPVRGSKTDANYTQAFILWALVKKFKISLPFLILTHMKHGLGKGIRTHLPYGMVLTLVFRHFEVDFEHEPIDPPTIRNKIDSHSLTLMGIKRGKGDGAWTAVYPEAVDEAGPSRPKKTKKKASRLNLTSRLLKVNMLILKEVVSLRKISMRMEKNLHILAKKALGDDEAQAFQPLSEDEVPDAYFDALFANEVGEEKRSEDGSSSDEEEHGTAEKEDEKETKEEDEKDSKEENEEDSKEENEEHDESEKNKEDDEEGKGDNEDDGLVETKGINSPQQ